MTYKVLKHFTDLQDNNFPYHVGDTFPREGLTVTPERIAELASKANRRGIPLIEEIPEKPAKEKPEKKAPVKDEPADDAPKNRTRKATK